MCNEKFKKGKIYNIDGQLYDAYGAVKLHIKEKHKNTCDYLLEQEVSLIGVTEMQRNILKLISQGKSDKEISEELKIASSTVRNHRFKLREKEKQAKLYLALMQSLEIKTNTKIEQSDNGLIEEIHSTAKMVDDRYGITEKDREKTLKTYIDENGGLKLFPSKEKKKIIILQEILKNFKTGEKYSESGVNRILGRIFDDYATLRRALIEYGFMERSSDCSEYRVKE